MTHRQSAFARLYAADPEGNATQAALSVGCSPKSAGTIGSRWLKNKAVRREIANRRAVVEIKLDISAERVLRELQRLAFLDVRKVFNEDGSLKPINELDDESAAAIAGLEHDKLFEHFGSGNAKHVGTTSKIKLSDKLRALELLGKWHKLGLFVDRQDVAVTFNLETVLEAKKKAGK